MNYHHIDHIATNILLDSINLWNCRLSNKEIQNFSVYLLWQKPEQFRANLTKICLVTKTCCWQSLYFQRNISGNMPICSFRNGPYVILFHNYILVSPIIKSYFNMLESFFPEKMRSEAQNFPRCVVYVMRGKILCFTSHFLWKKGL